jgi:DNA-binding MarR family transcriptional regulator
MPRTPARLVRLHLTQRARSVHQLIDQELRRLEKRATANLSREERLHLDSALTKVIRNLEGIAPPTEDVE